MSVNVDIMVDTTQTFEEFIQDLGRLFEISFTERTEEYLEVEYEGQYEQASLVIFEQAIFSGEIKKHFFLEDYRYTIQIHVGHQREPEKTERLRRDLSRRLFETLKATGHYRLFMTEEVDQFLDEYTPETFTQDSNTQTLKARTLPSDISLYIGSVPSSESLLQDLKGYFQALGIPVQQGETDAHMLLPTMRVFAGQVQSMMLHDTIAKTSEVISPAPAGFSYDIRVQGRVRLPGGLQVPGERRYWVYSFVIGLFEHLKATVRYRLLLRDEEKNRDLLAFDPDSTEIEEAQLERGRNLKEQGKASSIKEAKAEYVGTLSSLPPEIAEHYTSGYEALRLQTGSSQVELARTQELLLRYVPKPPAIIFDVGGGPGVYASWLAKQGYEVHLVDVMPLHVEQARLASQAQPDTPIATIDVGDARQLSRSENSVDVILLFGPLYHLTERADRLQALREARRILRPGGLLLAAGITRFASILDGMRQGLLDDPAFVQIVDQDLTDGQHRNPTNHPGYFTTAYFHHPDELRTEVEESGFQHEQTLPIEGPLWLSSYVVNNFGDQQHREQFLALMRKMEQEPSLLGVSAHLLVVARKEPK